MSYPYDDQKPGMFRDVWYAMLFAGVVLLIVFTAVAVAWVVAR